LQKKRIGHTLQNHRSGSRSDQFYAIAATMIRRILIDYAKTKHRVRGGGVHSDLPLENALTVRVSEIDFGLLALDEALDRLAAKEAQLAKVVELRFFSGLDVVETAEVLALSESTIKRDWRMAKTWPHN
jgi:RNA polymerase sigma factor (TIGR02999 family)